MRCFHEKKYWWPKIIRMNSFIYEIPSEYFWMHCLLYKWFYRGSRDRDLLDLQLPMQSVSITTDVVSSNLDQGEVYNIMW